MNKILQVLSILHLSVLITVAPSLVEASSDAASIAQAEKVVTKDGGILQLSNYAVVTIPPMAFERPTSIMLLVTNDKSTESEYRSSMVFFDSFRRLPNEMRVRVGANQPRAGLTLSVSIPKEFVLQAPKNHQVIAWVQVDQGDMDHFEVFPYTFSDKDSTVTVDLPVWAFTNKRPPSNREFEAIVIVGTGASSPEPDERDKKIQLLRQELAREREKVKELTAKLSVLRPPLPGEAISVAEIAALPEQYLDKEIVLEGVWLMGNFILQKPVGHFALRAKDNNAVANCYFQTDKLDPDSRRILVAKLPQQIVRVRGYLRESSKSIFGKASPSPWGKSVHVFDVLRVEH